MNNLIVISGPSGAGKSTLIRRLLRSRSDLNFSVSHTTRFPRPGEEDGREYHFVAVERFQEMVKTGDFAEWAHVHDRMYGTSWREIETKSTGAETLVLDIDVQGARSIQVRFPEALMVFIIPPSLEILRQRLQGREKHWSDELEKRLHTAIKEIGEFQVYEYLIVNDRLPEACRQLDVVVASFFLRMDRHRPLLDRLMGEPK